MKSIAAFVAAQQSLKKDSNPIVASDQVQAELNIPSKHQLFIGFMQLGLMGFGGVLPLARRMIIEQKKWLSNDQFTDLLGICQILPGGNIINMAVAIGMKSQGAKGAMLAVLGLMAAPTLIVVLMYQVYAQFQHIAVIQNMILGLAAAAAGLLFATGLKMLKPLLKNKITYLTLVLCLILMLYLKWSLGITLLLLLNVNLILINLKTRGLTSA